MEQTTEREEPENEHSKYTVMTVGEGKKIIYIKLKNVALELVEKYKINKKQKHGRINFTA